MRMLDAFPREKLKPLLPLNVERPDEACIRDAAAAQAPPQPSKPYQKYHNHTKVLRKYGQSQIQLSVLHFYSGVTGAADT